VVEEDLVLVRGLLVPFAELVARHVEQLVIILTGAFRVLTLQHVDIDDPYHGHPVALVSVNPLGEVGHVVHLYKGVDVQLHLVDVGLNQ
jgi:hypothetical protein